MFHETATTEEDRLPSPLATLVLALAATTLAPGCRSGGVEDEPSPEQPAATPTETVQEPSPSDEPAEPDEPAPSKPKREADQILDQGIVLRSHEEHGWGLHLLLPVSLGLTAFDLSDLDFSLDSLATIAVVPTAEFLFPLGERWTLHPYVGFGVAWQTGAEELVGDSDLFFLGNLGLRATRWQHFATRHWFGLTAEVRYDSALTLGGDELDDWGIADVALELRRDFGAPREGPRFQGGIYGQAFHVWDPISLDVAGIAPVVADDQVEFGVSLGSTEPYKLLGITLPRTFVGIFAGENLSGLRIRFGRL